MQDWLNLKSVINLDSAFCSSMLSSKAHRSMLSDLVQSDEYFICEQVTLSSESKILKVLPRFGEKWRSVVFANTLSPEDGQLVIANCHNLSHVHFRDFSASVVKRLQKLWNNKIVWLDLSGCYGVISAVFSVPTLCLNLKSLRLANTHLTDSALTEITKESPHIMHLDISDSSQLTDAGIFNTVVNLRSLRGLNIKKCSKLTNATLVHIYTHCARTQHRLQMDFRIDAEFKVREPFFSVAVISEMLQKCTLLHTAYRGMCFFWKRFH